LLQCRHLAAHKIAYIADEQRILGRGQRFSAVPLRLTRVASFPLRGWPAGARVLWKVE
jgi:hypothetical protein